MLKEDIAFIDDLGGTVSVAKACEITKGAVSQWRKNGIPKAQLKFLSLKFPIQYQQIYGDIELAEKSAAENSGSLKD